MPDDVNEQDSHYSQPLEVQSTSGKTEKFGAPETFRASADHYTSPPDDKAGGNGGFKVVMLNRKSLDNFEAELTSADDVEITPEYVILQATGPDGRAVLYGIWIFEDEEGGSVREG
ncbi:hypothetical protein LTR27_009566 [Elasticomyces elasticus]|nr:hypothetical protein LTR27_009566 [Elasticomyces elasticus]